jgi:PAS domain S-box-containing protein
VTHASSHRPQDPAALDRDELILALQVREHFLDTILGGLETFVAVDADWRVTFANSASARMVQRPAEEIVGGELWEIMPATQHEDTAAQLRRAMTERVSTEYEVPGPEGSTYLGSVYPLADGGLAIYARDVTDDKRRERERDGLLAALRQSEQSFAAVFEASPFAMSLTEMPSGTITRVNSAFEDLFGFTREELVGKSSPELGISDPASQADVARRFAEEGVLRDLEVPRVTRTGDLMTLSISLDWVTIDRRKFVLTSIRNLTRRVQSQGELQQSRDALLASERRYRSIVETTDDGIMIGDPAGAITFVNERMADMLGYGRDELLGMHGFDLIFPDWEPTVLDNRAALGGGEVVRGEFKLRRKDGTPVWTMFSSTPMFDVAGTHVGNLTMHSDITALRAAQEALRERELAAAAQEERSRLARDLHDSVTQALFAASLKAEALTTAGNVAPETARIVEDVRRLTSGALAQMRTMLLELRGESLDEIPIRQLLRNVAEATESRTQTLVELSIEGREALPPVLHTAIYRIAQEALNNVARHACAQHARVELQTEASRVRLSVSDDGRGFVPGPQGPAHLGLRSMVERAAEAGAELRIESAPGRGTSVVLEWRPGGVSGEDA